MVTVAYEQHIGRRALGQDCLGHFTAYASRTVSATLDGALDAWISVAGSRAEMNDVPPVGEARTSATEKYRYWRVNLADESIVSVTIGRKGDDKAIVAVGHRNVGSQEAGEAWKAYWKTLAGEIKV